MEIQWLNKDEFWKQVKDHPRSNPVRDEEFDLQIPLYEIRPRIPVVAPTFTPADECDFPGPVERWYGLVDGFRFMLTYHYGSPVKNLVTIQHEGRAGAKEAVCCAIEQWRLQSPY